MAGVAGVAGEWRGCGMGVAGVWQGRGLTSRINCSPQDPRNKRLSRKKFDVLELDPLAATSSQDQRREMPLSRLAVVCHHHHRAWLNHRIVVLASLLFIVNSHRMIMSGSGELNSINARYSGTAWLMKRYKLVGVTPFQWNGDLNEYNIDNRTPLGVTHCAVSVLLRFWALHRLLYIIIITIIYSAISTIQHKDNTITNILPDGLGQGYS